MHFSNGPKELSMVQQIVWHNWKSDVVSSIFLNLHSPKRIVKVRNKPAPEIKK